MTHQCSECIWPNPFYVKKAHMRDERFNPCLFLARTRALSLFLSFSFPLFRSLYYSISLFISLALSLQLPQGPLTLFVSCVTSIDVIASDMTEFSCVARWYHVLHCIVCGLHNICTRTLPPTCLRPVLCNPNDVSHVAAQRQYARNLKIYTYIYIYTYTNIYIYTYIYIYVYIYINIYN